MCSYLRASLVPFLTPAGGIAVGLPGCRLRDQPLLRHPDAADRRDARGDRRRRGRRRAARARSDRERAVRAGGGAARARRPPSSCRRARCATRSRMPAARAARAATRSTCTGLRTPCATRRAGRRRCPGAVLDGLDGRARDVLRRRAARRRCRRRATATRRARGWCRVEQTTNVAGGRVWPLDDGARGAGGRRERGPARRTSTGRG